MNDRDQEHFVGLVRQLFSQPYAPSFNNDLPLEEPLDVDWVDGEGRAYVGSGPVLAVHEQASGPNQPWLGEQRVMVQGDEAVRIAAKLRALVGR